MGELILLISIPLLFVVWYLIVKWLYKKGYSVINATVVGFIGGSAVAFAVAMIGASLSPIPDDKQDTPETPHTVASKQEALVPIQ